MSFNASELTRIDRILVDHRHELLEAWNEHFGL